MFAMGTVIDTALGLLGGIIGIICGPRLNKNLQEALLTVVGISLIILGLSNVFTGMIYLEGNHLRTQNIMLLLAGKGIIDLILVALMSASLGKGAIFANVPMFLLQIGLTALFSLFGDMIYPSTLNRLTLMGGVLIMCIGLNVAFDKKIRVMNLLPALVIALFWPW